MSPSSGRPATLGWWEDGERHLGTALGRLTDAEFDAPSLLPGWSKRTLLAHVARNADALVNLLTWARTGTETPMYSSPEARDTGIAEAVRQLSGGDWAAEVRTAQGRTVPASEVPWMRCREVWVHAVDLDAGLDFGDVPDDVLAALVDDVFRMWERRGQVSPVTVFSGDRTWGAGPVAVSGPLAAVGGWVTGRTRGTGLESDDRLPDLPAWF